MEPGKEGILAAVKEIFVNIDESVISVILEDNQWSVDEAVAELERLTIDSSQAQDVKENATECSEAAVEDPPAGQEVLEDGSISNPSPEQGTVTTCSLIDDFNYIRGLEDPLVRINLYIKKEIKVMILMRGFPGCGKTTLCAKLAADHSFREKDHVFSADNYFLNRKGLYSFKQEDLSKAHESCRNNAFKAMTQGRTPVIIDNTNTQAWEMQPYVSFAAALGYVAEALEPPCPWFFNPLALSKKNIHGVPITSICRMMDRYEANLTPDNLLIACRAQYGALSPPQLSPDFKKMQVASTSAAALSPTPAASSQTNKPNKIEFQPRSKPSFPVQEAIPWVSLFGDGKSIDANKLSSNLKDAESNTNYLDFMALRNIETGTAVEDVKVLTGRPVFFSACLSQRQQPGRTLKLDKGTMIEEENPLQTKEALCGLSKLLALFPSIDMDVLKDFFQRCNEDLDWAVNLLMDEGHAMCEDLNCWDEKRGGDKDNVPEEAPPEMIEAPLQPQKEPLPQRKKKKFVPNDSLSEVKKQVESSIVMSSSSYSDFINKLRLARMGIPEKEPEKIFEDNGSCDDVVEGESIAEDDGLVDRLSDGCVLPIFLDKDFFLSLQEHFGGGIMPTGMIGKKLEVKIPTSLARQIYSYAVDSVYQELEDEDTSMKTMIDEELARRLQDEENIDVGVPQVPDLKEIMDKELALNLQKEEMRDKNSKPERRMASILSKQILTEKFPKMDPKTLNNLFEDAGYSLHQAIEILSSAGHHPKPITPSSPTKGPLISNEAKIAAQEQAETYRRLALRLYDLRKKCYEKAENAYKEGKKPVAAYYSQLARWHAQQMEDANSLAASSLFLAVDSKTTTIDLHFLNVKEALQMLDVFIDSHIDDLQLTSNTKRVVYVITGRGMHSSGGVSKILPAVKHRLKQREIVFQLENPGMLKVIIKSYS